MSAPILTPAALDEIEAKAKAATPGKWNPGREPNETWLTMFNADGYEVAALLDGDDAAFIEACQPSTVLALVAALREARAALEPFAKAADYFGEPRPTDDATSARASMCSIDGINRPLPELTIGDLRRARAALAAKEGT